MINKHLIIQFGLRIRELREAKKISQEKLSFSTGFDRTYIGMIVEIYLLSLKKKKHIGL